MPAGVATLRRAEEFKLSRNVVKDFSGGTPAEVAERYQAALPIKRLPLCKPTALIKGENDDVVPIEIARRYEAAAKNAEDRVQLITLPNTKHFELIDPTTHQWAAVEESLLVMLRIS